VIVRMADEWRELLDAVRAGTTVRTHSGHVRPGDVFVALPGSRTDGTAYIAQAAAAGAAWIVAPRTVSAEKAGQARTVVRPDIRSALGELARARFGTDRNAMSLVGVTGTNGKTTVCSMLEHLLVRAGFRVGLIGTVSCRWPGHDREASLTTPECLETHEILSRMAADGVDVVCMEVSSHALDQDRVAGLEFDLGVFTNLTQDHLDYHSGMEAYFRAKSKLFRPGPVRWPAAVLNLDDPYGRRLAKARPDHRGYSLEGHCLDASSCLQGEVTEASRRGTALRMRLGERVWELRTPLLGRHNGSNLLAAQAAGLLLGLGPEQMKGLEDFPGERGRLEYIPNPGGLHAYVDFAHSPDALENVLSSVRELDFERMLVVFGCGGDRDKGKRPLMGRVVARYADAAYLTSDNPRNEDPVRIMEDVLPGLDTGVRVVREPDRREAIRAAISDLGPRDVLLVMGKGHESYQEIGGRRHEFSDADVVAGLLRDRSDREAIPGSAGQGDAS
jgi:UDP-N-acetylmuramoyl-L-alanyl-D-glutamate--2,6-diaminopimelate ligase